MVYQVLLYPISLSENYNNMPKIDKILTIEVRPEQYVNACDDVEFQELQIEVERRLRRELTMDDVEQFKKDISDPTNLFENKKRIAQKLQEPTQ